MDLKKKHFPVFSSYDTPLFVLCMPLRRYAYKKKKKNNCLATLAIKFLSKQHSFNAIFFSLFLFLKYVCLLHFLPCKHTEHVWVSLTSNNNCKNNNRNTNIKYNFHLVAWRCSFLQEFFVFVSCGNV